MNKAVFGWLLGIAAFVLAGAFAYHWYKGRELPVAPKAEPTVEADAPRPPAPPQYPVPEPEPFEPDGDAAEAAAAEALPPIDESDKAFVDSAESVVGMPAADAFLIPKSVIRQLVVTVDNLTDASMSMRFRAFRKVDGRFEVAREGEALFLEPHNYQRYAPFVKAVQLADVEALVALYFRWYPRFQEAYRELGYDTRYFNDRVIEVIDHLLATPDVEQPVELVQPKVLYQFKAPDLEALSVGQKALIRMGPKNARIVKAKLRELRKAIVAGVR